MYKPTYLMNRILSRKKLVQIIALKLIMVLETFFSKKSPGGICRVKRFELSGNLQIKMKVLVSHTNNSYSFNGLCFNIVDFTNKEIIVWYVSQPQVSKTDKLFRKYILSYKPEYLRLRVQFMGLGRPHVIQCSNKGFICASNGFYNFIININTNKVSIFPEKYLELEPMHYCKQGSFSYDGQLWYFVRWPLLNWAEVIDKKRKNVKCQVGRVKLCDRSEEILLELDYPEETHEITCSPNDKYLVFCTFKQDMYIPYPKKSFYKCKIDYEKSHKAGGVKSQELITVDLKTKKFWKILIPEPTIGHTVFDPLDANIFYLSAHNLVYHELTTFSEGTATLLKLMIKNGKTEIIGKYTHDDLFRIFQHQAFNYCGETFLAVMSYPNKLFIINAKDLSLYRIKTIGPYIAMNFSKTGNWLLEERKDIYFTVNASEDGRFVLLGCLDNFVVYDMEQDDFYELKNVLPKGFGMGTGHTRTYGV